MAKNPLAGFSNSPYRALAIGLIGALIAALLFSGFRALDLDEVTPAQVGQTLLGLILVALFIERATEVYVNVKIEPERNKTEKPVQEAAAKVRAARMSLSMAKSAAATAADAPGAGAAVTAAVAQQEADLTNALDVFRSATEAAAPKREEQRVETLVETSIVAGILGVLAAIVGVRALAPFLEPDTLFQCVSGPLSEPVRANVVELIGKDATIPQDQKQAVQGVFSRLCNGEEWQRRLFGFVDILLTGGLLAGDADGIHHIVERFLDLAKKGTREPETGVTP